MQIGNLSPEEFLKRFGSRCRALRIAAGYTSTITFAIAKDFNPTQWADYERGEVDVRLTTLIRIFKALAITPTEFFSEGFDK